MSNNYRSQNLFLKFYQRVRSSVSCTFLVIQICGFLNAPHCEQETSFSGHKSQVHVHLSNVDSYFLADIAENPAPPTEALRELRQQRQQAINAHTLY